MSGAFPISLKLLYLTRSSVAPPTKVTSVMPEGYVIRRNLSVILTHQQAHISRNASESVPSVDPKYHLVVR
jgi:hypothetical protein